MKWTSDMNFNGKNYAPWKARVKTLLQAERLWEIVTRAELPPPWDAHPRDQDLFWNRENEATAFLMTTLSDEMVVAVSNKRYAYEIFEHLEKTYEPRNWGSLCALREQFVTLKYQDGADMLTHINGLKTLAGRLSNQGKPVDDTEKVCQLLSSLPRSWDSFKSHYYIQETPIAWSSMETNVMAEATRRNGQGTPVEARPTLTEANAVTQRGSEPKNSRRVAKANGEKGHHGDNEKQHQRARPTERECFYCHQQGHYRNDCPMRKRHCAEKKGERSADTAICNKSGQEEEQHVSSAAVAEVWGLAVVVEDSGSETLSEDWNGDRDSDTISELMEAERAASAVETASTASEEDEEASLFPVRDLSSAYWYQVLDVEADGQRGLPSTEEATEAAALTRGAASSDDMWIVDSGCSQHICYVRDMFDSVTACGGSVTVANNATEQVEGVGTVKVHVRDAENKVHELVLSDVLFLPGLRKNLISVTQLAQKGVEFDFHTFPGKVVLQRDGMRLVSESQNGVCVLKALNKAQFALYVFPQLTTDLLHRRFGHAAKSTLVKMEAKKMVTGLKVVHSNAGDNSLCDACQLGTKKRSTFPSAPRRGVAECNDAIHSDICGPVEIPSLYGQRYVLLFVDVHSRYCHVYLLDKRSEFGDCVVRHKAAIENHHSRPLKKFVSDNGGEYISDEFKAYCEANGIARHTTTTHTPEQNGMAEVRFRVLFNKVRTVLIDSSSPKQLWGEAILVVVYLQNRTMNATTQRTPFEDWYGFPPDVSHLRVFGSLAYVYLPTKLPTSNARGIAGGARSNKRQKLDYRSVRGIFVGYAPQQKAWKVLDCSSGKILVSCHVSFDESFSPAAEELRRQEFRALSSKLDVDFNYYSRSATSEADLLFYSMMPTAEKPTSSEVDLLEDFVSSFDMSEVNMAEVGPVLRDYDSIACAVVKGISPQVLTKRAPARNPVLHVVRKQQEAAALVALENIAAKTNIGKLVATGISSDPKTYNEAVARPDAGEWKEAIHKEMASLKANKTWTVIPLPPGKRALSCRWLFKTKYNSDGTIERRKARLVVIGCQQVKYVDFDEIFAPVVRLESLRVLLAIACIEDLECHQMDIETAFLNGTLKEEVYMKQPQGMEIDGKEEWVCKLAKSLYGLKQAPRAWHKALTTFLGKEGFEKLSCESCIYVRKSCGELEIVAIYVDDLLLLCKSAEVMKNLKQSISGAFKAKDLGEVSFILGLKITRDRTARKLWISQRSNAEAILKKFNMEHSAGVATPTAAGKKLTKLQAPVSEEATAKMLKKPFRQAVGSLMYQMIGSRPDLAFAVQDVSRYLANYGGAHWEAVKRCIRYLKATLDHGLEFSGNAVVLKAFTDSDYAGCEDDRRSVSGYVTMIGNCAVTWSSRKQRIVAQSTAEADYVALAHCTREVLFLRQLLKELGYEQPATVVNEDNQACIAIAENPSHHTRVKHIDVRYHFIREHVQLEEVALQYVMSKENVADMMTKGLAREQFEYLRKKMKVLQRG